MSLSPPYDIDSHLYTYAALSICGRCENISIIRRRRRQESGVLADSYSIFCIVLLSSRSIGSLWNLRTTAAATAIEPAQLLCIIICVFLRITLICFLHVSSSYCSASSFFLCTFAVLRCFLLSADFTASLVRCISLHRLRICQMAVAGRALSNSWRKQRNNTRLCIIMRYRAPYPPLFTGFCSSSSSSGGSAPEQQKQ